MHTVHSYGHKGNIHKQGGVSKRTRENWNLKPNTYGQNLWFFISLYSLHLSHGIHKEVLFGNTKTTDLVILQRNGKSNTVPLWQASMIA